MYYSFKETCVFLPQWQSQHGVMLLQGSSGASCSPSLYRTESSFITAVPKTLFILGLVPLWWSSEAQRVTCADQADEPPDAYLLSLPTLDWAHFSFQYRVIFCFGGKKESGVGSQKFSSRSFKQLLVSDLMSKIMLYKQVLTKVAPN